MTRADIRQVNINCMDRVVDELAAGKSISDALSVVYTRRRVKIPMDEKLLGTSIVDIGFSNRTTNAIRRAHMHTVRDLIDYLSSGHPLYEIKNLGGGSQREVKEGLLNYAWRHMSQAEKDLFLIDTVARNINNVRV